MEYAFIASTSKHPLVPQIVPVALFDKRCPQLAKQAYLRRGRGWGGEKGKTKG